VSWSALAARIAERNRAWVNSPALPPRIDPREEEDARRDAVRLALDRARHGEPVAHWTSVSPIWDRVGLTLEHLLPRSDRTYT